MRISDWSSDVCSSDLGSADVAMRRHHDNREIHSGSPHALKHGNAVDLGHPDIEQNATGAQGSCRFEKCNARAVAFDRITLRPEKDASGTTDRAVIVDDMHKLFNGHRAAPIGPSASA